MNTSESWSRSHSVGFDLSTVGSLEMSGLLSFRELFSVDNLRQLGATLSTHPTVRAEHIESIHQTYSDAGIKTSKGFNVAGQTTELKPDLKNEDKIKVFDSSTINSIGENLTAVGQLRESLRTLNGTLEIERLKTRATQKITLYSVAQQTVADTVVVKENDSEQDPAPQPEENRVVSLGVEALIDDLSTPININNLKFLSQAYFENTNENQPVKRASSPEPVDTELRKAEKAAVDTMCKIADKWNAVKPHTGPYTKAVAEVAGAVSKAIEPINEFIVNPALKYLNTGVRRGLRDGCEVSQGLAQDIGDITSITAGILITGTTAKVVSNGGKLVEFNKLLKEPNAGKLRIGAGIKRARNPNRPTWRQTEIDEVARHAGQNVETQVSFMNGERCTYGLKGSVRVDLLIDNVAAIEMKNYNLVTNVNGLVNDIVKQAIKHKEHLPQGVRQVFKVDTRGQEAPLMLQKSIKQRIVKKSQNILGMDDIEFIRESKK